MRYLRFFIYCSLFANVRKVLCPLFFYFFLGTELFCTPNKNYQTYGVENFQGIWEENLSPEKSDPKNLYRTQYTFRFYCDSVYITTRVQSRYSYEDPHCFNTGKWTEYQKGGYILRNDSIIVEGVFAKSNFRMKISGCYHSGNFHEVYRLYPRARNTGIQSNPKLSISEQSNSELSSQKPDSLFISSPHEAGILHLYRTDKWKCLPHKLQ